MVNHTAKSSKKCSHCGLTNFPDNVRCGRCGYDVWVPSAEANSSERALDNPREFGWLKVGSLVVAAVLLLGLVLLFIRQDSKKTTGAATEAAIAQPESQLQAEESEEAIAQRNVQSQDAAKHVLAGLKHFHLATQSNMSFEEYDEKLTRLKADLNNTLPSFVDHKPSDESFRVEVNAAIRDYTAAGNWWKTVINNSSVFTDTDRTERLIPSWTSAKTHLDKAEQMLVQ